MEMKIAKEKELVNSRNSVETIFTDGVIEKGYVDTKVVESLLNNAFKVYASYKYILVLDRIFDERFWPAYSFKKDIEVGLFSFDMYDSKNYEIVKDALKIIDKKVSAGGRAVFIFFYDEIACKYTMVNGNEVLYWIYNEYINNYGRFSNYFGYRGKLPMVGDIYFI